VCVLLRTLGGFVEFRRCFGGFACFRATEIVVKDAKVLPTSYIQL
jgi:hypothetical protein